MCARDVTLLLCITPRVIIRCPRNSAMPAGLHHYQSELVPTFTGYSSKRPGTPTGFGDVYRYNNIIFSKFYRNDDYSTHTGPICIYILCSLDHESYDRRQTDDEKQKNCTVRLTGCKADLHLRSHFRSRGSDAILDLFSCFLM